LFTEIHNFIQTPSWKFLLIIVAAHSCLQGLQKGPSQTEEIKNIR